MKQFYQFLFIVGVSQLALTCLHAQINQWTWVGGNKLTEQSGKYGTKGVASPNNYPGSRSGSISFSDKNGNFWLFGGTGIDANGNSGLLNDLWKWDGTSWTWVTGNNTINQNGTHITRGTPDPRNVPGSRQLGAGGVDKNGNVWIFGGEGLFDTTQVNVFSNPAMNLNDLWKWDGTNWTWLKGGNNGYSDKEPGGSFYYYGIYGTQGVPTATNYPGVRKNCVSWTDTNGNLWLYGGDGSADSAYYPTGSSGALADLWKWDGTYWTWINGSRRANVSAFYGIKGTGSAFNSPGGRREGSTGWTDANGNFWLFGGYTYNQASPFKMINDLWKWDGITWTWVSGSDTASQPGNYGTKGVSSTATVPGARSFGNGWADNAGNFWIFGGICAYPNIYGTLNDLWKFDGTRWTWMKGSDSVYQPANFGTKGITSANNTPGSRWKAMNYTDKNGKLLLFGGSGPYNTSFYSQFNNLNDLWIWDGNNWTWLNGTDSTGINEVPVYGTRGVAAASNRPGARANSVCWTDSKGNFWLFGGLL
jgi:N-acetylneuraminic acid mutarotase